MIRCVKTPIGELKFSSALLLAAFLLMFFVLSSALISLGCSSAVKEVKEVSHEVGQEAAEGALAPVASQVPVIVAKTVDSAAAAASSQIPVLAGALSAQIPVVAAPVLKEEGKALGQVMRTEHTLAGDVENRVFVVEDKTIAKVDGERTVIVGDVTKILDHVDLIVDHVGTLLDRAEAVVARLEKATTTNVVTTEKTTRDYVIEILAALAIAVALVCGVVSLVLHWVKRPSKQQVGPTQ
jgi:hypothetical protein